ncbi:alpha/beta fold hydrolase [Actinoplanes xinjiangensis]|uniref:alpha/beta fold hydrolase n=1 Tax=Actinoplanes xinjiangensis TaxID=512350 RepID=UPI00130E6067|nr:alpha/beta fold hydrolase [Actinoplanes xinjiangensis]
MVRPAWRDRRIAVAVAVLAAGGYGLLAAWWTPRGPVTNSQAVAAIVAGVLVGAVAGVVLRSRWAMLLGPVAFMVVFEVARMGTVGPMVDGIHPGSTYGLVALVLGRGLHAVLALVPMLLGGVLGAAAARRLAGDALVRGGWSKSGLWTRRVVTALLVVGLLGLTVAILRPAGTEQILGPDGKPRGSSVAELIRVPVGGHDLAMMIRGADIGNPVLLYLAGGPGGSDIGAMRRHGQLLEEDFTVATFDQRGAGKSADNLEPTATLTLDRAVSDAIEVTKYLRQRFGQDKIYVVGNSWGTILGVLAVQRHPELYRAFVGTGQMVDPRETDRLFYADTLAWARRTGDTTLAETLTASGPPPYADILDYEPALTRIDAVHPYDHTPNAEGAGGFAENLFVPEYSLMEQVHNLPAWLDVFAVLYPHLQDIDFRTQVPVLDVPVYLVQGRHEQPGRASLAEQWFQQLKAPSKQMIVFDTAGHRSLFERPDLFHQVMTTTVLPQT